MQPAFLAIVVQLCATAFAAVCTPSTAACTLPLDGMFLTAVSRPFSDDWSAPALTPATSFPELTTALPSLTRFVALVVSCVIVMFFGSRFFRLFAEVSKFETSVQNVCLAAVWVVVLVVVPLLDCYRRTPRRRSRGRPRPRRL